MRRLHIVFICFLLCVGGLAWFRLPLYAQQPPLTVVERFQQNPATNDSPRTAPAPIPSFPSTMEGLTIYISRTDFIAAHPTIPYEDLGDTSTEVCLGITAIPAPLNAQSDNDCYNPGDIMSGLEFRDMPLNDDGNGGGDGLVYAPPGSGGVTDAAVTGNHFTNTFEILLTPSVTVVGMDLVTLFGEAPLRVRLFGDDESQIFSNTIPAVGPAGLFLGFHAPVPIKRVELFSANGIPGEGAEGVAGIFFGTPTGDQLSLALTVGTNPNSCATTNEITVPPDTEVTYCYTLTNNSPITFSTHTLTDTVFGTLLEQAPFEIAPGASYVLTASHTPDDDNTNNATWTAQPTLEYQMDTGSCGIFPDITATGTPLNLGDDDYTDVSLPMTFQFYDLPTTKIFVSNNGLILLEEPDEDLPTYDNFPFPTNEFQRVVAPFWDDLDEQTGNVYVGSYTYDVQRDGGNALLAPPSATTGQMTYFAIEWFNRRHFDGPDGNGTTFTTLLAYPGQGIDNYIVTCYADTELGDPLLDYGASATIGINQHGGNGQMFSYNEGQTVLTGSFGVGYAAINPGVYVATDSATVTVFNPDLDVTPLTLNETHNPAPITSTRTLTLTNTGTDPLNWNLYESVKGCGNVLDFGWLTPTVLEGNIPRGGSVTVPVVFNSTGLPDSTYSVALCIASDDPDKAVIEIPVNLTVLGSPEAPLSQLYLPIVRRR
jgi:hypothetical protein